MRFDWSFSRPMVGTGSDQQEQVAVVLRQIKIAEQEVPGRRLVGTFYHVTSGVPGDVNHDFLYAIATFEDPDEPSAKS